MILGRKPEAVTIRVPRRSAAAVRRRGRARRGAAPGAGGAGDQFVRPTDVAWDARRQHLRRRRPWRQRAHREVRPERSVPAHRGARADRSRGQFNIPHSIAIDAQGNVYVADQGNKRIQVFDNDGTFKIADHRTSAYRRRSASRGGSHQYLYSSHAGDEYGMDDAAIYKIELDGRVVGKFGTAGKQIKEFGLVNAVDCRTENDLYVGELTNWRVQKLTLHPKRTP